MVEAHWNSCALLSWSRVKKAWRGWGGGVGGAPCQNETNLHIFKLKFLKSSQDKIQNISNRFWILQLRLVMYYPMHYFPKTFNISWVVRVHASCLRATAGWRPYHVHHRTTQIKRQSVTLTVNWKLPTNRGRRLSTSAPEENPHSHVENMRKFPAGTQACGFLAAWPHS